jgi:hypothetical protein
LWSSAIFAEQRFDPVFGHYGFELAKEIELKCEAVFKQAGV